jgi:tRNA threonylcarbamoyl adenosine modification protein YjeE
MSSETYTTNSATETIEVARNLTEQILGNLKTGPVVISLLGDYGVGKTQFVKGLAQALSVQPEIVSPSYVYMRNYPFETKDIQGELVHIDAWRIKREEDFKMIGIENYLKPGCILAIEWPQQFAEALLEVLKQSGVEYQLIEVSLAELGGDKREISMLLK